MSNSFTGSSYATEAQRNRAVCQWWLWADGWNCDDDVKEFFEQETDADLARNLISDWPDDDLNVEDLIEVFAELREEIWRG